MVGPGERLNPPTPLLLLLQVKLLLGPHGILGIFPNLTAETSRGPLLSLVQEGRLPLPIQLSFTSRRAIFLSIMFDIHSYYHTVHILKRQVIVILLQIIPIRLRQLIFIIFSVKVIENFSLVFGIFTPLHHLYLALFYYLWICLDYRRFFAVLH